jgi:hypothetical protein
MSDENVIGRIMDKAGEADRRALFAGLQAALVAMTDLYYSSGRPTSAHAPSLDEFMSRIEKALDVGAPYGSPEQIAEVASRSGE